MAAKNLMPVVTVNGTGVIPSQGFSTNSPATIKNKSVANHLSKQIDSRKFGEFTVQPVMSNKKAANWQIKVW